MKTSGIILFAIMICFSVQSYGQKALSRSIKVTNTEEATTSKIQKIGAFGELIKDDKIVTLNKKEVTTLKVKGTQPPKSKAMVFHTAKQISNETGYFIQLHETEKALEINHKVFQEFGNLKVEATPNDVYCYLIGSFVTKDAADKFLNGIILSRYPDAKVVKLKNGKRK